MAIVEREKLYNLKLTEKEARYLCNFLHHGLIDDEDELEEFKNDTDTHEKIFKALEHR